MAAALRRSDPALDDVARSLGAGPVRRFLRVTLPSVRTAMLGGTLVVALYLLAEYGTFAVLRFRTFATAIFTQYTLGFDAASASLLTLVLCLMGVLLLGGEYALGGRNRHPGARAAQTATRVRLGRATPAALLAMAALVVLSLGVPVGSIAYWMVRGGSTTLPSGSVVGAAVQVAPAGRRHRGGRDRARAPGRGALAAPPLAAVEHPGAERLPGARAARRQPSASPW